MLHYELTSRSRTNCSLLWSKFYSCFSSTNYFKISEKCPFNASKYFSFQISNFKLLLFTTKSLQRAWISGAPATIFKWYAQSWHESWHEECWSSLLKSFAKGGWQDFELYKGSSLALFNLDKDKVSRAKTRFSSSLSYNNQDGLTSHTHTSKGDEKKEGLSK